MEQNTESAAFVNFLAKYYKTKEERQAFEKAVADLIEEANHLRDQDSKQS